MARYTKVSQKDLDSMRSNVEKMNVESVVKELEGYMCFDDNQNKATLKVWKAKMKKAWCWLYVLKGKESLSFDYLSFKVRRFAGEPWNPDDYCRIIATIIQHKLTRLQFSIERMLQEYGIESTIGQKVANKQHVKNNNKSFSSVIQAEDKDTFLQRLHKIIDCKGGKDVAAALFQAKKDGFITRYPTKSEYEEEFTLVGSWQGIYKHLVKGDSNDMLIAGSSINFK
jgi:hypothetical protein